MNSFFSPSKRVKGQGLVEYAIILALVAIVVVVVARTLGPSIGNTFTSINNSLDNQALLPDDGGDDGGGGGGQITGPYSDWHDAQNEFCVGMPSGTQHDMYHDLDDDLWIAGPSGGSPPSGYIDQTDVGQWDTCP